MGAFSGSPTASRFFVDGEVSRDVQKALLERIRLRAFVPLEPDLDLEERVGWCVAGAPNDLDFSAGKLFYGDYLALGFRWDRWRFPKSVVSAQLAEAMGAERTKRGAERLSREARAALQQKVIAKLKKRYFPALKLTDVCWNRKRGLVHLFGHSKSTEERFCALFELTFGVALVPQSPYTVALRSGAIKEARLATLELTSFIGESG